MMFLKPCNTLEIAEKCNVEIDFKTKHYPVYIPPALEGRSYTKEEQVRSCRKISLAAM